MNESVVFDEIDEANINLANMVTTLGDMLIKALHPGIFTKGNVVWKFVFQDAPGILKHPEFTNQ